MSASKIAIIGGDRRTALMIPYFLREGYRVVCFGCDKKHCALSSAVSLQEAVENSDTIVCGIPFARQGFLACEEAVIPLAEFKRCLRRKNCIFGGVIPEDFRRECEEREIRCYDFLQDEPLAIYNSVATAEGAVLEAILHSETLLHQSRCLVLGYGRCGKALAQRLVGLSARVSVGLNGRLGTAQAQARGLRTFPLAELKERVKTADYIFNTIPACYLDAGTLEEIPQKCLVIDIASGMIGVDYHAAEELGRKVLYCPGLPGKYSAESCAARMAQFVIDTLQNPA